MKEQIGRSALARSNLYVLPANPTSPTCLQSFKGGFFCCKASGIMLRGRGASAFAVTALGGSEDALRKARGTRKHFANATNFDNVYTDGNNHSC
jgi:hypothetical protein